MDEMKKVKLTNGEIVLVKTVKPSKLACGFYTLLEPTTYISRDNGKTWTPAKLVKKTA